MIEMGRPVSFLSLLELHEQLDELFYQHQEALLKLDVSLALERFDVYERRLREHIRHEEERLLPVYERAGRIEGGAVVFFTGEHKRMLEFLTRIRARVEDLIAKPANLEREIISLFDQQAMFKQLVEHHDQRERNILYPTLDKVTDENERRLLLEWPQAHRGLS